MVTKAPFWIVCAPLALCLACAVDSQGSGPFGAGDEGSGEDETPGGAGSGSSGPDGGETDEETGDGKDPIRFDVDPETGGDPGGGTGDECHVVDDMDGVGPCLDQAPPNSFDAVAQWEWDGVDGERNIAANPLVANLTDDNGDGSIDLCDVPDIIVIAWKVRAEGGSMFVLDGETGEVHFRVEGARFAETSPALGDIDSDGLPEIVAMRMDLQSPGVGQLAAIEHDGTLKWTSATVQPGGGNLEFSAIALADVDTDGDVEILAKDGIFDHDGNLVVETSLSMVPVAVDLDGDGDMEILPSGYANVLHHDGSLYFPTPDLVGGYGASVANLDSDPDPEILYEFSVIEHDGQLKTRLVLPDITTNKPTAIHDIDGDDLAELIIPSNRIGVGGAVMTLEHDGGMIWVDDVSDGGHSGGTAFDFLGDGGAEVIYSDMVNMFVYDEAGNRILSLPRSSYTNLEYPVVADVDNDGAAEVVVVSNDWGGATAPSVRVFRDALDRWVPARRIWNQHTYHVTNVREDGTIPQFEPPHWQLLNTFRTQAQIGQNGICDPEG